MPFDTPRCACKIAGRPPRPLSPNSESTRRFVASAERPGHKIYIVKVGRKFHYIGMTKQALGDRMKQGFYGNGKRKYLYMWRHLPKAEIFVWRAGQRWWRAIETIEAELVFFVRRDFNRWPEHQVEIHFHNPEARGVQGARRTAKRLYAELKGA
jgi:hypothetical protein